MKNFRFIISIIILLITTDIYSQIISAEIRPRAEYRNGYKMLRVDTANPAYIISQRSRLSFQFQKNKFEMAISVQDVRVWGDEENISGTGVFGNNASIDLNEAWIKMSFLKNSSVKIGRQYFNYDDARLLSNRNWNQHSLAYDAILYQFKKNTFSLDLGFSYNNRNDEIFHSLEEISYPWIKTLSFLHASKKWSEKFHISGIILTAGYENLQNGIDDDHDLLYTWTYGINMKYKEKLFNIMTSFYYQNGKNFTGNNIDGAINFNGQAEYTPGKLSLRAGYTLISGNDLGAEEGSWFNIMYGARHKYYGLMDYFSALPKATNYFGLQDLYAGVKYSYNPGLSANIDFHYFATQYEVLADPYISSVQKYPKDLGYEVDTYVKVKLMEDVVLNGGFSFFTPQDNALKKLQKVLGREVKFSHWAWVMITAKPTIFGK